MSNDSVISNSQSGGRIRKMLERIIVGTSLQDAHAENGHLKARLKAVNTRLESLVQADRTLVRGVIREMLNTDSREKIQLLRLMALEQVPHHGNTPLLLAALRARIPVWLWGDAGSGKTTAAAMAAQSLQLEFRHISVCPTTTKSEFLGFRDATGVYHRTAFRDIYEHGGVFLIDEMDNGNPSILAVLNTALANDHCAFPDGNIKRHENALFVAAANTIGRGADVKYIGRNALDAATLDRFVFVRMDIDENVENAIAGQQYFPSLLTNIADGGTVTPKQWLRTVRAVRRACKELGIQHLVSPRATIYGQRLIQAGVGKHNLVDMCLWKGLRETDRHKITEFVQRHQRDD